MSDLESSLESKISEVNLSSKVYRCSYLGCEKYFSRPSRLETHYRIHSGERPFKCDLCEKDYARNEHLKRHIAISHYNNDKPPQERVPCTDCQDTFANKYSLAKHRKKLHLGKSYRCDICSKDFSKHNLLSRHRSEHFSRLPHSCDKCGKMFRFPNKLRLHEATHNKKYECKVCGLKDFNTWSEVRKHNKNAHKLNENTEFKCEECKKTFSSQKVLDKHLITHGSERIVFHCPVENCTRFYCYERNLNQHIRTYHDEKRIKCSVCPRTFVSNAKLKYHMERFHGEGSNEMVVVKKEKKERCKRKDEGSKKKSMAEILSGYKNADPDFGKKVLLQDKVVDLNIDSIREEIFASSTLTENFEDSSDDEFPIDAVQVCKRKFKINQTKSSIMNYIT